MIAQPSKAVSAAPPDPITPLANQLTMQNPSGTSGFTSPFSGPAGPMGMGSQAKHFGPQRTGVPGGAPPLHLGMQPAGSKAGIPSSLAGMSPMGQAGVPSSFAGMSPMGQAGVPSSLSGMSPMGQAGVPSSLSGMSPMGQAGVPSSLAGMLGASSVGGHSVSLAGMSPMAQGGGGVPLSSFGLPMTPTSQSGSTITPTMPSSSTATPSASAAPSLLLSEKKSKKERTPSQEKEKKKKKKSKKEKKSRRRLSDGSQSSQFVPTHATPSPHVDPTIVPPQGQRFGQHGFLPSAPLLPAAGIRSIGGSNINTPMDGRSVSPFGGPSGGFSTLPATTAAASSSAFPQQPMSSQQFGHLRGTTAPPTQHQMFPSLTSTSYQSQQQRYPFTQGGLPTAPSADGLSSSISQIGGGQAQQYPQPSGGATPIRGTSGMSGLNGSTLGGPSRMSTGPALLTGAAGTLGTRPLAPPLTQQFLPGSATSQRQLSAPYVAPPFGAPQIGSGGQGSQLLLSNAPPLGAGAVQRSSSAMTPRSAALTASAASLQPSGSPLPLDSGSQLQTLQTTSTTAVTALSSLSGGQPGFQSGRETPASATNLPLTPKSAFETNPVERALTGGPRSPHRTEAANRSASSVVMQKSMPPVVGGTASPAHVMSGMRVQSGPAHMNFGGGAGESLVSVHSAFEAMQQQQTSRSATTAQLTDVQRRITDLEVDFEKRQEIQSFFDRRRVSLPGVRTTSTVKVAREAARVIHVSELTAEHIVLREQTIEKECRMPKKVVTETVIEKEVVVPEKRIQEQVIEETKKVLEKVIEIRKPIIQEKLIEIPEIIYTEKIIEVPEKIIQEKVVQLPVVTIEERVVEIPKIIPQEKVVEVIEYEHREVPIEKLVEKIVEVEEMRIKEIPVPRYIDRPVPEYVTREISEELSRVVPVPVEAVKVLEFKLPRMRAKYVEVPIPVYSPRFIEVAVPAEALSASQRAHCDALAREVASLAFASSQRAISLCEIERIGAATKAFSPIMRAQLAGDIMETSVAATWCASEYVVTGVPVAGPISCAPTATALSHLLASRGHGQPMASAPPPTDILLPPSAAIHDEPSFVKPAGPVNRLVSADPVMSRIGMQPQPVDRRMSVPTRAVTASSRASFSMHGHPMGDAPHFGIRANSASLREDLDSAEQQAALDAVALAFGAEAAQMLSGMKRKGVTSHQVLRGMRAAEGPGNSAVGASAADSVTPTMPAGSIRVASRVPTEQAVIQEEQESSKADASSDSAAKADASKRQESMQSVDTEEEEPDRQPQNREAPDAGETKGSSSTPEAESDGEGESGAR